MRTRYGPYQRAVIAVICEYFGVGERHVLRTYGHLIPHEAVFAEHFATPDEITTRELSGRLAASLVSPPT